MAAIWGKALDYDDVLLVPTRGVVNSRADVQLWRSIKTKHSQKYIGLIPIIISNMDTTGTLEMCLSTEATQILTALHKYISKDKFDKIMFSHFVSFGMYESINEIESKITGNYGDHYIMLDVANGYIPAFLKRCEEVRKAFPNYVIAAGNICTSELIDDLNNVGIDIVKIGIGAGGHCRTREVTGVGYPQFSAVEDCAAFAHSLDMHIIADGGINTFGDIGKAFGAGADFVMCGSMFAGFDESGGDIVYDKEDRPFKPCYGMASKRALDTYGNKLDHRPSEGRETLIPYRGPVEPMIKEMLAALRSTISYTGFGSLQEFIGNGDFVEVNNTINQKYVSYTVGE